MTRLAVLLLGCAACFGEGPTPEVPADAKVIFYVPPVIHTDECNFALGYRPYVGDVAIGNGYVHVVVNQWNPPNNCGGNTMGQSPPTYDVPVHRIPLNPDEVAEPDHQAGTSHGNASARVAAVEGISAWAWNSDAGAGMEFNGVPPLTLTIGLTGGVLLPTGFVAGPASGYLAATTSQTSSDVFNPAFPSNGGPPQGATTSKLWRIRWAPPQIAEEVTIGSADAVYAETVKSGLVANTQTLFYASYGDSTGAIVIKSLEKTTLTGTITLRATVPKADGVLVGMDANDTYLVWSTSPSYRSSIPPPSCVIKKLDLVNGGETVILDTNRFACLDAAFDGTHVYFTIFEADMNDNDGTPGAYGIRGVGLGRVPIDGGEPETVRHGVNTLFEGPRRVYLDGDDMYAVDSFAIVRIKKSALTGKHDF